MKQITKIIYTAGVVEPNELDEINIPEKYPNVFRHHMTIQFGNLDTLPDYIGKEIVFRVDTIFEDEKAIAVSGFIVFYDDEVAEQIHDLMISNDQIAHITLATAEGIKPVYSNELVRSKNYRFIVPIDVRLRVGAFCVFDDNSTGWVYEK